MNTVRMTLVLCGLVCWLLDGARIPASSQETDPPMPDGLGVDVPFENPEALTLFHDALRWTEDGLGHTRIAIWGASHTASDHYPGRLRELLQHRFGDAGRGWALLAWQSDRFHYWQWGVEIGEGRGWHRSRLDRINGEPGYYGIANLLFQSQGRAASARISTSRWGVGQHFSSFEFFFLEQPGGGTVSVQVDDGAAEAIDTSGPLGAGYFRTHVDDAGHALSFVVSEGAPVGAYGVVLERDVPGVILDNFAITAGRARDNLRSLDPVFTDHLRRRSPHLVIFAYGGNESNDTYIPASQFRDQAERGLRRVLDAAPGASCLVLGPFDKPLRQGDRWVERPRLGQVRAGLHAIAQRQGCAFFDAQQFMGGPMSMLRWVSADPPLARDDHVHLSAQGYRRLAEVLYQNLVAPL